MSRFNFRILIFAVVCCVLCSGFTLRDRILIDTKHKIETQALYPLPEKVFFENTMHGMFDQLLDEKNHDYSQYIPHAEQAEYEAELENRFEGIGVVFRSNPISSEPEVVYPFVGSPAFRAGIRAGDKILAVDGKKTSEIPFAKISQSIKGPLGSDVVLSVLHFGEKEPVDISVKRAPIKRDSVEGGTLDKSGNRVFALPTEPEIGYMRITSFSDLTADEVEAALHQILDAKRKGLILDLRGNPGGFVSTSVAVANFFVEPNEEYDLIVSTRYRDGSIKGRYRAFKDEKIFDLPMVVLIDGESASASEILSACLQDYRRATIVGTRSFGKGTVQEIFDLPLRSGKYQLTDASYWRPSGQNINRDKHAKEDDEWGVTPDSDCVVPVSKEQQYAMDQISQRRSNIVDGEREPLLKDYIEKLPEEIGLIRARIPRIDDSESKDESSSKDEMEKNEPEKGKTSPLPFVLQGNSPYFDPQLDKAIKILRTWI